MFILDANVFISAFRQYYSFDIVPSFWNCLEDLAQKNYICSIDRVYEELTRSAHNPDQLHEWSQSSFDTYFKSTVDNNVINAYGALQRWANDSSYFTQTAKSEFASNADAWLIAYAKATGGTLVTHEAFNIETKNRILIPVACKHFEISYINTFDMLRELEVVL